jgi:hypothetical protein
MIDPKELLQKYLELYEGNSINNDMLLNAGLCKIKLKQNNDARDLFETAIINEIAVNKKKKIIFPWEIIYMLLLSGRLNLIPSIKPILEDYRLNNYAGYAPLAIYCYLTIDFFQPSYPEKSIWINKLKSYETKKKLEDIYPWGYCFQALIDHDENTFNDNIAILLRKHERVAKHGSLRETSEGYYSLDATCLSFCAIRNGMRVDIINDYLPIEYLSYIQNHIVI